MGRETVVLVNGVKITGYNDEIDELLESLTKFTSSIPFEVVIVEDGSTIPCEDVIKKYINVLCFVKGYELFAILG